jgi:hypothetical protein
MRFLHVALLLLCAAACVRAQERAAQREPEPARARAALAIVRVDNRTAEHLLIAYRLTGLGSSEVGIGRVEPRDTADLAPVPAGEPIILIARTPAGLELVLPARSLEIDGSWMWLIPEDARFVRGGGN